MSTIQIRAAGEPDVPQILELVRALADYEQLSHLVTATEEKLRESMFGPRPAAEALLALDGDDCVGLALYFHNYSTFLAQRGIYLEDLYVKPESRGKGVGFALLRRLAQIAIERNCGRLEWQVLDWNQPSIEFYRKLGAAPQDQWTTFRLTGEAMAKLASAGDYGAK